MNAQKRRVRYQYLKLMQLSDQLVELLETTTQLKHYLARPLPIFSTPCSMKKRQFRSADNYSMVTQRVIGRAQKKFRDHLLNVINKRSNHFGSSYSKLSAETKRDTGLKLDIYEYISYVANERKSASRLMTITSTTKLILK